VHDLFLVVLLAALNATAPSQEFTTPFKPAGEQLPDINMQSLWAPFRATHAQITPLDWFTPSKCTFGEAIDCVSRDLSGDEAVDCGRVRLLRNPNNANNCVIRAFNQRKPFRVRYDQQGFDTLAARGIVMTPDGRLIEIGWASNTWLASAHIPFPSNTGYVDQHPCTQPARLKTNSQGELECSPLFIQISDDIWFKLSGGVTTNSPIGSENDRP
jgi:hypothetical protein